MARSLLIVDRFAPEAAELRSVFDERFADPRRAHTARFVWDYWHVPGQYTALRTPAWTYFPERLYERFHRRLVLWGRRVLGCHDISPPWLSLYVDGCGQELHGDLPHGPWAFVFSLTHWQRRVFSGGETELLADDVLDYWTGFASTTGRERHQLVRTVEPRFARLVAFDPRLPHGVRSVSGTRDPRLGRLVVNGWFVQPRPFIEGPLREAQLAERIASLESVVGEQLDGGLPVAGLLSFGIRVGADGRVAQVRVLSDTTRVPSVDEPRRLALVRAVRRAISGWRWSRLRRPAQVTLPLVFSREG